ncbi:MAG: hypothetical protein WCJ49_01445, partial [Deltaproteobacteria bacterium]
LSVSSLARLWFISFLLSSGLLSIVNSGTNIWQFISFYSLSETSITNEMLQKTFQEGKIISVVTNTALAIGALTIGILSDNLNKKQICGYLCLVAILAGLALQFVSSFVLFLFFITVCALCLGGGISIVFTIGSTLFRRRDIVTVNSVITSSYCAGIIFSAIVIYSTRHSFVALPFEVVNKNGISSNILELSDFGMIYIISTAFCSLALLILLLWKDYCENKAKKMVIT